MKRTILIDGRLVPHIHGGADSQNAQIGSGVAISFWNTAASPPAYESIGYVRQMTGLGVNRPEVDSTTLDDAAVARIAGLPDGKTVTIVCTTTGTVMERFEGFLAGTAEVDLKVVTPSPANKTRYFAIIPLDYDHGTISPSGLMEITLQGRITGNAPSSVDPNA